MRVAVYCPDFHPSVSGYSHAFQDLVRGLCGHGTIVDVFTPVQLGAVAEMQVQGLTVHRVTHSDPFVHVRYLRALWNLFANSRKTAKVMAQAHARQPYDLVVAETLDDPLVIKFLPPELLARTIVRIHACAETEQAMWDPTAYMRLKRHVIDLLLRKRIRFIAATAAHYLGFVRKWYLRENALLIADKRFCVIPNAAPRLVSGPRQGRQQADRVSFLTLGRMDWVGANQKGFDDILMALMLLQPQQRARMQLTVIGRGSEQPRLKRLAAAIPQASIEFIEALPNAAVRERLAKVDCVILASRYEGMSIFALEALGSGAPVIFSDAGGIGGLVQGNGRRFSAGDPESLAQAIGDLVDASDEDLHRMSAASLDVAARLTPADAASSLLRFAAVVRSQVPA